MCSFKIQPRNVPLQWAIFIDIDIRKLPQPRPNNPLLGKQTKIINNIITTALTTTTTTNHDHNSCNYCNPFNFTAL